MLKDRYTPTNIAMHATRVPTVLIGIGGIGGEIVQEVNKMLIDYDRQFVQMLILDTDVNALGRITGDNIPNIQTSSDGIVSEVLRDNPDFLEWFPTNPLINGKSLTQGAGQVRSISRLAARATEKSNNFDKIKTAVDKVQQAVGNNLQKPIRIMIVGSLCGGTGSGIAIQLPFIIRDIATIPNAIIRGVFLTASLLDEKQQTPEEKRAVYVNEYAFVREYNAFNLAQMGHSGTEKLSIEHYVQKGKLLRKDKTAAAAKTPYDFLFLIEKSNTQGNNIGNFEAYKAKAAEIVKAQLFTPVLANMTGSNEDNLIIAAVNTNGMNRYCGAGVSKLVYPEDEIYEYCKLRFAKKILNSSWLIVDDVVDRNLYLHSQQMAADASLEEKDRQAEFMEVFCKLKDPKESDIREIGLISRDLFTQRQVTVGGSDPKDPNGSSAGGSDPKDPNGSSAGGERKETKSVDLAEDLFKDIEKRLEECFDFEKPKENESQLRKDVRKYYKSSAPTRDDFAIPDMAAFNCANRLEALRNLQTKLGKWEGNLSSSCTEDIIGSTLEGAQNTGDYEKYPYSIFAAMKKMHPLAARYLLYKLREQLNIAKNNCQERYNDEESKAVVFKKDYYYEGKNDHKAENPAEAFSIIKPSILKFIGLHGAKYNKLREDALKDIIAHRGCLRQMALLNLKKTAYKNITDRIDQLIELYDDFFEDLKKILHSSEEKLKRLERDDLYPRRRHADIYVCADSLCKKILYEKFEEKAQVVTELDPEVKEEFFTEMFRMFADRLQEHSNTMKALQKNRYSSQDLYESFILNPIMNKLPNQALSEISMTVFNAIERDYEIRGAANALVAGDVRYDVKMLSKQQYFSVLLSEIASLAKPYISCDDESKGKTANYVALSQSVVAEYQGRDPGQGIDSVALQNLFNPQNMQGVFIYTDDSLATNEIVCYVSIYDLCIENLKSFRAGSKAKEEYDARLDRVNKANHDVGAGDKAYLDVVHPHLDKHWHAHAYLPMVGIEDEKQAWKDIIRAFLLGVACNRCRYMESDCVERWVIIEDKKTVASILLDGKPATNSSLLTLYHALDESPVSVSIVHNYVEAAMEAAYDSLPINGVDRKGTVLLQQPIILGLIGRKLGDKEKEDLQKAYVKTRKGEASINVLDLINLIYLTSHNLVLVREMIDTLTEFIKEYCIKMTNGQEGLSEVLFGIVAKAIGSNSVVQKSDEFLSLCEDYV